MYASNTNNLCGSVQELEPNASDAFVEQTNVMNYTDNLVKVYKELEEELAQKENDIKLLKENELLLNTEIKAKQKDLGIFKMELLTELDNFDNIENILNEETEFISGTALGQEVVSKQTKFYIDQIFKAVQFQETCEGKVSTVNHTYEKILVKYKEDIDKQKLVLTSMRQKKIETSVKELPMIQKIQHLEEQLNAKVGQMERYLDTLNMEYCKQNAVIGYLKGKGDEIFTENNGLKFNLENTREQEQEININENKYTQIKKKLKMTGEELLKVKQNIVIDSVYLGQLLDDKITNNHLLRSQEKEADIIKKHDSVNNEITKTEKEIEQLIETLHIKIPAKEKYNILTDDLKVLQNDRINLIEKDNEASYLKEKSQESCEKLQENLEELIKQLDSVKDVKNSLELKKTSLDNNYEAINDINCNDMECLVNQVNVQAVKKSMLEIELKTHSNELESNVKIVDNCLREIQHIKLKLKDNSDSVTLLHDEVGMFEKSIEGQQTQYTTAISTLKYTVCSKNLDKTELGAEIERLNELHSEIVELVDECYAVYMNLKFDLSLVKENLMIELQVKKNKFENNKNELERIHKEKMNQVSYLNGDIIEGGRNEIYLSKKVQELAHFNETKKREISVLSNAIDTLDNKLHTIAKTVSVLSQDTKGFTNSSTQSTVILSEMRPPTTTPVKPDKKLISDDSSSSSGESMCGNNKTWRKNVIKKQQYKRENLRSQRSQPY